MKRKRANGWEQDLFSQRWRHMINWRPGERARIRRQVHKRERREGQVVDVWIGSCCICRCEHDHLWTDQNSTAPECVMCKWCTCAEHGRRTDGPAAHRQG